MRDPCRELHASWRLEEFLDTHPSLRVTFLPWCALRIKGDFSFRAVREGFGQIEDTFSIGIEVAFDFPKTIPKAFETENRIPQDYHHFTDGSLCLGSPLRQRLLLAKKPTLPGFAELLLIPYLFNRSCFESRKVLPIGELDHGAPGLVADYEQIFRTKGATSCIEMLNLLGLHKRTANKFPCPCGSGRRLGKCHNTVLTPLRKMAFRSEFRQQRRLLLGQLEAEND